MSLDPTDVDGVYAASAGAYILDTIQEAIELAGKAGSTVRFGFNHIGVIVASDSVPDLVFRDWKRALDGCIDGPVGPYPTDVLSVAEMAHDDKVQQDNRARRLEMQNRCRRESAEKQAIMAERLAKAPPIDLVDQDEWQQICDANLDPYGAATVRYAERWARLIQMEILAGRPLEEVVEPMANEADVEGITGFMHSCAVSILSRCWRFGEQLRKRYTRDPVEKSNSGSIGDPRSDDNASSCDAKDPE